MYGLVMGYARRRANDRLRDWVSLHPPDLSGQILLKLFILKALDVVLRMDLNEWNVIMSEW